MAKKKGSRAKKSGSAAKKSKSKAKRSAAKKPAAAAAKKRPTAAKAKAAKRSAKTARKAGTKVKKAVKKAKRDVKSGHPAAAVKQLENAQKAQKAETAALIRAAKDLKAASSAPAKPAKSHPRKGKSKPRNHGMREERPTRADAREAGHILGVYNSIKHHAGMGDRASNPHSSSTTGGSAHAMRSGAGFAKWIGGVLVIVGSIGAAEIARRWYVTRAVTPDGKPFVGLQAMERIMAPPDKMQYAVEAGAVIVTLGGAAALMGRMPKTAAVLGLVGTGFAIVGLSQAAVYEVMPRLMKVAAAGEDTWPNRIYSGEQLPVQDALLKQIADENAALVAGAPPAPASRQAAGVPEAGGFFENRRNTGHAPGNHAGCGEGGCTGETKCGGCAEKDAKADAMNTAGAYRADAKAFEAQGNMGAAREALRMAAELEGKASPAPSAVAGAPERFELEDDNGKILGNYVREDVAAKKYADNATAGAPVATSPALQARNDIGSASALLGVTKSKTEERSNVIHLGLLG